MKRLPSCCSLSFVAPQRTLKGIYNWAQTYYYRRFRLPSYKSFVRKCHQALAGMLFILDKLLVKDAPLRFMDSTMLHVCELVRANRHKVAKAVAGFGYNWQGCHYGFKLHVAVNPKGQLAAVYFTPANEHDGQQIPHLVNDATVIAVGDGTYNASVMRARCGVSIEPTSWHRRITNKTKSSWSNGNCSC